MARRATEERKTKETSIRVELDLDGTGVSKVRTPLPFLTHMVEQLARQRAGRLVGDRLLLAIFDGPRNRVGRAVAAGGLAEH